MTSFGQRILRGRRWSERFLYWRRVGRALRWRLLLTAQGRVIEWDLLREPRLRREIPAGTSAVGVFVPVPSGGLILDRRGRQGLPLMIRLLRTEDGELPSSGLQLATLVPRAPLIVVSVRSCDPAASWELAAKFREPSIGRAARLAFVRLAPADSGFVRATRVIGWSFTMLGRLLDPFRWFRGDMPPQAGVTQDFSVLRLSPGQVALPQFWPTMAMAFLFAPLLAASSAGALLSVLGYTPSAALFGAVTALAVAAAGGVACGSTVSVVAASVGAIPLVAALGSMNGRLLDAGGGPERLLAVAAEVPLREVALGGLPLLVPAPAGAVAWVVAGIFTLAFAMAVARAPTARTLPVRHPFAAVVVGVGIAGAGPGLVAGGSLLLERHLAGGWPLLVSLGVVGGAAFALPLITGSRSPKAWQAALAAASVYAVAIGLVLPVVIQALGETVSGLVLTTAGVHVLLQGTFFAAAYLLAERLGGRWAGAWASALEGAVGYVAFLVISGRVVF